MDKKLLFSLLVISILVLPPVINAESDPEIKDVKVKEVSRVRVWFMKFLRKAAVAPSEAEPGETISGDFGLATPYPSDRVCTGNSYLYIMYTKSGSCVGGTYYGDPVPIDCDTPTTNAVSFEMTVPEDWEGIYKIEGVVTCGQSSMACTITDTMSDTDSFMLTVSEPSPQCTDTDGGKDYDQKGTATDDVDSYTDHCKSSSTLVEMYCMGGTSAYQMTHSCGSGKKCDDGACVEACSSHEYKECYNGNIYWYDSCDNREEQTSSCEYGCDNAKCTGPDCSPEHDHKKCYDTDVYWFDSCGERNDVYQQCGENQLCEDATCKEDCQTHSEQKCNEGDVYWFDSCGNPEEVLRTCDNECEDGVCKSVDCESQAELRCYGGNVYWYNSCGNKGELKESCASNEECIGGVCKSDNPGTCVPGNRRCSGATVKRCNSAGNAWESVKDCQENQVCQDGRCTSKAFSITHKLKNDWRYQLGGIGVAVAIVLLAIYLKKSRSYGRRRPRPRPYKYYKRR